MTGHPAKQAAAAAAAGWDAPLPLPRHASADGPVPAPLCGFDGPGPVLMTSDNVTCGDCLLFLNACRCHSCGGQCGGTNLPGSCGALADVAGYLVCEVCRGAADVWDHQRTGVRAALDQDKIRVRVIYGESAWLDARGARVLAELLHRHAAALDLAELAEAAGAEQ